jgi:membrane-bound serine protease (ClpP class)
VSLALILPTAAVLAGTGFGLGYLVLKSRGLRARSGLEALVGEFGETREPVTPKSGKVFVQGELWNAITEASDGINQGTVVVVKGVRGMSLVVEPQSHRV